MKSAGGSIHAVVRWVALVLGVSLIGAASRAAAVMATGGTVTETGGHRIHTFTTVGSTNLIVTAGGDVQVLVVAGGGGGGSGGPGKDSDSGGGGGGAGGLIYSNLFTVSTGSIVVVVGAGGAGGSAAGAAAAGGSNSSFGALTAVGGGRGACAQTSYAATSGGSGGGASYSQIARGNGTAGQGYQGGSSYNAARYAGGSGGGAGAAGQDSTVQYGNGLDGGAGVTSSVSGAATMYAGGGGSGAGGWWATVGGAGGAGGGGMGGHGSNPAAIFPATSGMANTGGGGGGGGCTAINGTRTAGGSGGSGIVIVKYFSGINNANGATNVTSTSAWLNGTLASTGTSDTAVFVFWALSDGGTNASAWANTNTWAAPQETGQFTVQASGLSADSTWYYRFAASNEAGWKWPDDPASFITGDVWIENTADASEIGPTPGTFTVHRASAATNEALTVVYAIGGTATPGTDYAALGGSVTMPAGADSAAIEVSPSFDHSLEGTETVAVTVAAGPYVMGASSNAAVAIADYGLVTRTWSGGGTNALASNPTNWVGEVAPVAGDAIVIDATTNKNMTWDLNIPVQSWIQNGYTGTVTMATVYPAYGSFTNFTILDDCVVSNGSLTHVQNAGTQKYRLSLTVGGDLTIGPAGSVHGDVRGYAPGIGPGTSEGAAYGGIGAGLGFGAGRCYGSITDPADLGSGGRETAYGGGALLLRVAGEFRNDGNCSTDGGTMGYGAGSGGSIWVFASSLTGVGRFSAKGGDGGIYRVGGGGRMAFILTNPGSDFNAFTGTMTAYSGVGHAFAGTVYRETVADGAGHGELIVDNLNGYADGTTPYPGVFVYGRMATELNYYDPVSYAFSRIVLTNKAVIFVGSDDTLDLRETELVGGGRSTTGIRVGGGTILTPSVFTWSNLFFCVTETNAWFSGTSAWVVASNAELRIDKRLDLTNGHSVSVKRGGLLTHTPSQGGATETYTLDLALDGSLLVEPGGSVDVSGRGFPANNGPGTHPANSCGASHGGLGVGGLPCYGSIASPTNYGSGGRSGGAGGGVIRLAISGTVSNGGAIRANAAMVTQRTGAGGSVSITAGALAGAGPIEANSATNVTSDSPGGGGRVAVTVTNAGETVTDYAGAIAAYGGRKPASTSGGAGTVYLRDAGQGLYEGTLIVDNNSLTGLATEVSSNLADTAVFGNVVIRRRGYLLAATNHTLTVGGIWSNTALFAGQTDSEVIFAGNPGSTSTVYGATTFRVLTCTRPDKTLLFETGATNIVEAYGRVRLRGVEGTNLVLRPTAGSYWYLNVSDLAETDVEYVDVGGSTAGDAAVIAKNSIGAAQDNVNWTFLSVGVGETNTWTGENNALWGDAGNWSLARAPVEADVIVIPGGCTNYPVFDAARTMLGLEIQDGGRIALNGWALTVTSNAVIAGDLVASATETITFRGDADFTGGSFTQAFSTVSLAGSAAQAFDPGDLTFYNVVILNETATVAFTGGLIAERELRCEAASGTRSLTFRQGAEYRLRDLVVLGAAGQTNITLRSSSDGNAWGLNVTGYRQVRGVDVKDSDARGGLPVPAVASLDSGSNSNWQFNAALATWVGTSGSSFHTAANWSPPGVPGAGTRVLVEATNALTMTGTVSILNLTVGGTAAASVTVNGALTVGENVTVLDDGTLTWNRPGVVSNSLIVAAGGRLTHQANTTYPSPGEQYKVDLRVGGDVEIDAGGAVDTTGRGYAGNQGPGTAEGASHGGVGLQNSAPCYGSILAPTNIGSGGRDGSLGGGAIRITAAGRLRNDGVMRANGTSGGVGSGSGGSIYLTAGALAGSGTYAANGGAGVGMVGRVSGGGRMAFVVTQAGAGFDALNVAALDVKGGTDSGSPNSSGGSGTIYMHRQSEKLGRGTVRVANFDRGGLPVAEVPSLRLAVSNEADHAVFRVRDGAWLRLTNNFEVGDIFLETANARLDLRFQTLTVHSKEHSLAPGTVMNYGAILWIPEIGGTVFVIH